MNLVKVYEDKMPQYFFNPKMNSTKPLRIEISLWVSFSLCFVQSAIQYCFLKKKKKKSTPLEKWQIFFNIMEVSEQSPNNNSNTNLLEDINFGRVPVESNAATTIYRH